MRRFFLLILPFLILSCVPKSHIKQAEESARQKAFAEADRDCLEIQRKLATHMRKLEEELNLKNALLRKFNQVDEEGNPYAKPEGVDTWGK